MNSEDIIWIPGYNLDSNCYLIDDMLVALELEIIKNTFFLNLKNMASILKILN